MQATAKKTAAVSTSHFQCTKPELVWFSAAVSKAFSCLSNADNRAAYDRYGDQEGAAGFAGQRRAGPTAQGFGGEGFDAEEIFNMFFGNGFGAR